MNENKKTSIIRVLQILEEYSDENHYITQSFILEKLNSIYGLELERKSVANSIQLLQELDYDIVKGKHNGFALLSRDFDPSEVTFLVDAIFSSKSISGSQSKALAEKVSHCLSIYDRKTYNYLDKTVEFSRTDNKEVFYNIEIINEAIKRGKYILFKYMEFDENGNKIARFDGYTYSTSPCYLINNFCHYYYLGYRQKYDSVSTYRVDYMQDVSILEDSERIDPKSLKEFANYKNVTDYMNDHIYLFGGPSDDIVIELKDPYVIQYIYDWFGHKSKIYKKDDKLYAKVHCNLQAFYYWSMQYSEHIKVISPESIIDKIKSAAQEILNKY